MNENLKNRIIGVIVLISLAIIIAPMVFTGTGHKNLKFKKIEDQTDIKFRYIDEANNLDTKDNLIIKDINIKEESIIIKDSNKLNDKSNDLGVKNWIIRVGSFANKENALKQLKKLDLYKHKAHIVQTNANKKVLYAVNIGPFFSASVAKKNYLEIIKNKNFENSYIIESGFRK